MECGHYSIAVKFPHTVGGRPTQVNNFTAHKSIGHNGLCNITDTKQFPAVIRFIDLER